MLPVFAEGNKHTALDFVRLFVQWTIPMRSMPNDMTGDGFPRHRSQEEAEVAVEKLGQLKFRGRRLECVMDIVSL